MELVTTNRLGSGEKITCHFLIRYNRINQPKIYYERKKMYEKPNEKNS